MIAPECVALTEALRDTGLHVTIETAGTVYMPVACDLISISPKLSNSTPHEREGGKWAAQHDRLRYQPDVLRRLMSEYRYQLKFVVSAPADVDEVNRICDELQARREHVILMPEGTDRDLLRERGQWLTEVCKQQGFRYGPRLHIDLWGNKRGM